MLVLMINGIICTRLTGELYLDKSETYLEDAFGQWCCIMSQPEESLLLKIVRTIVFSLHPF